jgi:hypothetical protein
MNIHIHTFVSLLSAHKINSSTHCLRSMFSLTDSFVDNFQPRQLITRSIQLAVDRISLVQKSVCAQLKETTH